MRYTTGISRAHSSVTLMYVCKFVIKPARATSGTWFRYVKLSAVLYVIVPGSDISAIEIKKYIVLSLAPRKWKKCKETFLYHCIKSCTHNVSGAMQEGRTQMQTSKKTQDLFTKTRRNRKRG